MKQFIDFIPLILFFIVYKLDPRNVELAGQAFELGGIFSATAVLIISSILVYGTLFVVQRKLEKGQWLTLVACLVFGGMTLALMTMPVIVISARNALKAVPPSIRDAALAVGASRVQTVFHHVLPLAMPGILTGTIIGMARALGETAPLLMIGMRAFVATPPEGLTSPATVLPVQIFLWSDEIDRGFVERTSAAIIVLLLFLLAMNGLAIYLRNRFEKRW